MLSYGAIRSITLFSLILRVVTAAQAAVCTSLISALLLEQNQVRLSQLAQFSVTRGINAGPRQLLQEILLSGSSQLRRRCETLLLSAIVALTIGIQFSTILLPDLQDVALVGNAERFQHRVAITPSMQDGIQQILGTACKTLQGSDALFGETKGDEPD